MSKNNRSGGNNLPGITAWAIVNLLLLATALVVWGWFDYRYIHEYWTPAEMQRVTNWMVPAIAAVVMLANLWLLRRYSTVNHLLGALGSAVAITALWWAAIALAGNWFHVAVGGTPAS